MAAELLLVQRPFRHKPDAVIIEDTVISAAPLEHKYTGICGDGRDNTGVEAVVFAQGDNAGYVGMHKGGVEGVVGGVAVIGPGAEEKGPEGPRLNPGGRG